MKWKDRNDKSNKAVEIVYIYIIFKHSENVKLYSVYSYLAAEKKFKFERHRGYEIKTRNFKIKQCIDH